MKKMTKFLIMAVITCLISSCEDNKNDGPASGEGNILVSTMLPNPDGMSGSAYMQLIGDLEPAALTNTNAIPVPFSSVPIVRGNDVYVIPGWGGETDIMIKYSRSQGKLVEQGEFVLPAQSGATNVVTRGDLV